MKVTDAISYKLVLGEVFDPQDIPTEIAEALGLRMVHPVTLFAWERIRRAWGKAIRVNSCVRTPAKQQHLVDSGNRGAATVSPHVIHWSDESVILTAKAVQAGKTGLQVPEPVIYRPSTAMDLDTNSEAESAKLAALIRRLFPEARIFFSRYFPATFVHFDMAPVAYGYRPELYLAPGEQALPSAWLIEGVGDPITV